MEVSAIGGYYFLINSHHNLTEEKLKADGVVTDALPDTKFKVKLEDGKEILAYLSGKMRMNYIKVMVGDKVTMELSPDGKGRIIYRK
jgi:translation initiation factor IF-1